jgi:hypothetical protein
MGYYTTEYGTGTCCVCRCCTVLAAGVYNIGKYPLTLGGGGYQLCNLGGKYEKEKTKTGKM